MKISRLSLLSALTALSLGACSPAQSDGAANGAVDDRPVNDPVNDRVNKPANRPAIGLVTSLPIYWPEAADIAEALSQGGETHWVKAAIERDYVLETLDLLSAENMSGLERLAVIQPRALTPAENVALDDWVAAGGRLLLVLDPMLTDHSRFSIGDPRRPADVALIPPLLRRWGLAMRFDEGQEDAERTVRYRAADIPVRLGGRLATVLEPQAVATCSVVAQELIAQCARGEGRALILADAALFEDGRSDDENALRAVIQSAFGAG